MRLEPATKTLPKIGRALLVLFFLATTVVALYSANTPSDDAEQRVQAILSRMTLEEKIDMIGGVDDFYIRAYPQLGLPRLRMSDGPLGVRNAEPPSTVMAGPLAPRSCC